MIILFILILLFQSPSIAQITSHSSAPEHQGIALGLFSKEANYNYEPDLIKIKSLGITHVLLVVSWYQDSVTSEKIFPTVYDQKDNMTIPDAKLVEVIQQAHSLGLKVFLFPIIRLIERKSGEWRGVLKPNLLVNWFKSYESFILHYASMAEKYGVALLSVGSELGSLEKERDAWQKLIQKIRTTYHGKLIYSANWDHYQQVSFWDQLDYIGLTAYYELTKSNNPTLAELTTAWQKIKNDILFWQKNFKQKIIFTEIGYPSMDGTNRYPWNYFANSDIDLAEQALCYEAFIQNWSHIKELAGVYFWVWWGAGGPQDKSYTPYGKPAGGLLKTWYSGS